MSATINKPGDSDNVSRGKQLLFAKLKTSLNCFFRLEKTVAEEHVLATVVVLDLVACLNRTKLSEVG